LSSRGPSSIVNSNGVSAGSGPCVNERDSWYVPRPTPSSNASLSPSSSAASADVGPAKNQPAEPTSNPPLAHVADAAEAAGTIPIERNAQSRSVTCRILEPPNARRRSALRRLGLGMSPA
jgi:hypothetical protein